MSDLRFWFDPVCPFAWLTSKWVRRVAVLRGTQVDWRFISLRMVNAELDYAEHFPPEYEEGHTAGLQLLRVAAASRAEHGNDGVGRLYRALGELTFDRAGGLAARGLAGTPALAEQALERAGLPVLLATATGDETYDLVIREETDEALHLAGKDVGTPILQCSPPDGPAFFGPVISRVPEDDEALALWDHVSALAAFPGFAELKRSLREPPQLAAFGLDEHEAHES